MQDSIITLAGFMAFLSTGAGVLVVNVVATFLKENVYRKWGAKGVHAVVFIGSVAVAAVLQYVNYEPGAFDIADLKHWGQTIFTVYTAAVALYELILKRVGF